MKHSTVMRMSFFTYKELTFGFTFFEYLVMFAGDFFVGVVLCVKVTF